MHFFYLDESGCTGNDLSCEDQPIFVFAGISVRDEGWNQTNMEVKKIINDYFGGNIPPGFELHAQDLLSLAINLLSLLGSRSHNTHLIGLNKRVLSEQDIVPHSYIRSHTPYLLGYDYMITLLNWIVKEKLGRSARGMIILDKKQEFSGGVEAITGYRRYLVPQTHRVKWIVEFSYPVDSRKNPMIQLSDLVAYCSKRFLEIESGLRPNIPEIAKKFYAQCYEIIDSRLIRKTLIERSGRDAEALNDLLHKIEVKPRTRWKAHYGL